jgi:hypothetical protein
MIIAFPCFDPPPRTRSSSAGKQPGSLLWLMQLFVVVGSLSGRLVVARAARQISIQVD